MIQTENESYWQNNNYLLLQNFQFFEHMHSKFTKSTNLTSTFFFKIRMGYPKTETFLYFKLVEMGSNIFFKSEAKI
jgi:hypothetical protein